MKKTYDTFFISCAFVLMNIIVGCSSQPSQPLSEKDQLTREIAAKDSVYSKMQEKEKLVEYEKMVTLLKTFTAKYPDDPKAGIMINDAKKYAFEMGNAADAQSFALWYMDYCKLNKDCEQAQLDLIEANYMVSKDKDKYVQDLEVFMFEFPDSPLAAEAKGMMGYIK